MSKRHFDEYFNKIANDYIEMLDTLKDLEEESIKGLVDPDKVEQMKQLIIPLKNNYLTLSWVMYLLNKPNKSKKIKKYEKMYNNKMNNIDPDKQFTPEAVHKTNEEVIDNLKSAFN